LKQANKLRWAYDLGHLYYSFYKSISTIEGAARGIEPLFELFFAQRSKAKKASGESPAEWRALITSYYKTPSRSDRFC
jgi:hypothetical protein